MADWKKPARGGDPKKAVDDLIWNDKQLHENAPQPLPDPQTATLADVAEKLNEVIRFLRNAS